MPTVPARPFLLHPAALLALIGLCLAVAALLPGWLFGADIFLRGPGRGPAEGAMVPSTALCMILLNTALLLDRAGRRGIAKWMARLALLIAGLATAPLLLTGVGADYLAGLTHSPSDRMAPATAIGVLLATICARALQNDANFARDIRLATAVFGLSSALTLLISAFFSLPMFHTIPGLSVPTTLCFTLFFGAVILTPADPPGATPEPAVLRDLPSPRIGS